MKVGDDNKVLVAGRGMVDVFAKNGDKKHINDVYFVPLLKCNLISIGQLMDKGCKVIFNRDMCVIFDKYHRKRLVVRVKMAKNRMFPLNMKSEIQNFVNAYKVQSLDKSWLWHLRYGNLYFVGLSMLQRKQSGNFIKVLRSNIGSKYKLSEFMEFCNHHGIKRQFTACYTLQ